MKNLKISKNLILIMLIFLTGFKCYSQTSNGKAFIELLENLSKCDFLNDYKDRSARLSKDFKNKLIISDLRKSPILKTTIEKEGFILAPYAKIRKSDARFYVLPTKVFFTKDSSYIEFELINKYNLHLNGKFTLTPDSSTLTNGSIKFKSCGNLVSIKKN